MTLRRWGVNPETEPRIQRRVKVISPHKGTICGWVGRETQRDSRARVYAGLKHPDYHRFEKYGGYAISADILQRCEGVGVSRIFLYLGDTHRDDVLEFRARDYYDAPVVAYSDLHGNDNAQADDDPQRVIPDSQAFHVWPNYGAALFPDSFEDACRRIDREWRWNR